MDDLDVLAREFGLGVRGKANPMRPVPSAGRRSTGGSFSDVYGGHHKYTPTSNSYGNHRHSAVGDLDYNSIFRSSEAKKSNANEKSSSVPVSDKPVYDDDMFDGLPGMKSKPGGPTMRFNDDVVAPPTGMSHSHVSDFDDFLGNLGRDQKIGEKNKSSSANSNMDSGGFDDLLAGFGNDNFNTRNRSVPESRRKSTPYAGPRQGNIQDSSFIVLESNSTPNSSRRSPDPLEGIGKVNKSRSGRVGATSSSGVFAELDPLSTIGKPGNLFSLGKDDGGEDGSNMEEKVPVDNFQEPPLFDAPNVSTYFQKSSGQTAFSPQYHESPQVDACSTSKGQGHHPEDFWLTISDVPLFTQPTIAPPPSQPPPPIPRQASRSETRSHSSSFREKGGEFSSSSSCSQRPQGPNLSMPQGSGSPASQFDELEEFAMGRSRNSFDGNANFHLGRETNDNSEAAASAAAMKDATDKPEAKFRNVKEASEKENVRAARSKGFEEVEKDEREVHKREFGERRVRLERERKHAEEEEREQERLERERLRKIETEKARQAVERANREAREQAAAEAQEKAITEARIRAERAAVGKANAEALERAVRASVQRAQGEARDRAAAEARGREEKATAEAWEKERQEKAAASKAEANRRAERAAVERAAAAGARERAAAQAREKAASSARTNQKMNDNDLESFFGMGRAGTELNATNPFSNQQFNSKVGYDVSRRTAPSSATSSTVKKASSATNFVDDLSSIFGAAPSGEFQEVEGESDERRKARLERYQRTQERAAKALDEKNQRDLQSQREQEERHRVAQSLDIEIKRWTAGREGNLRALLSTLQYVLWPECGWQPIFLTDLITAASVKKAYRKATLCVHPDKVQQKGANLQQKYIAEKVFDLLKEAWNKFNSEELF